MIPYIAIPIIIMITYGIVSILPTKKNKKSIFINIAFIELFVFLAIRDVTVGPDMKNYIMNFKYISSATTKEMFMLNWEPLFILLNKGISLITTNKQIFVVITSFLGLIGPYVFIKKYSKNYFWSIFLFITLEFFSFYIFSVRQCIAISILLFSVRYIQKSNIKSFLLFLLCVILATLLHKSSIVFLIVYFIARLKISSKQILYITGFYIILFVFKDNILNIVMNIFYSQYVNNSVAGRRI